MPSTPPTSRRTPGSASWFVFSPTPRTRLGTPFPSSSPMKNETHTTLRFPETVAVRVDSLLAATQADPDFEAVRLSRQFIMRKALMLGIREMEQKYECGSTRKVA